VLRKKRFAELVDRQLDVYEEDASTLLGEAAEADAAWTNAAAEDSEELYGDYQLVVDAIGDQLLDIRETYAATLDGRTAERYRAAFDRAARKRYGRLAAFLGED
jgi:hypothetical protein